MNADEVQQLHYAVYLADLSGMPVAVGFVQLVRELKRSGALSAEASNRVRDAIVGELTHTRHGHATLDEFAAGARARLDKLLDER